MADSIFLTLSKPAQQNWSDLKIQRLAVTHRLNPRNYLSSMILFAFPMLRSIVSAGTIATGTFIPIT